jgi:hypothetical protein
MNADEKKEYRICKVRYNIKKGWHALNRAMERGFPIIRLREIVFRAKWFPDIDRDYIRFAVFKDGINYWTLVLNFRPCCIHADTVWPSKPREIQDFKSKK